MFQAGVSSKRMFQAVASNKRFMPAVFTWAVFTGTAFQTYDSNASDVQLQVSRVRGGGGRGSVVAVTSIGSTAHPENVQMAKVLDGVRVGDNTGHD